MRIEVVMEIKTHFVVSDTGYTSSMTLPEIEKWAKEKIRFVDVYLKEGSTDTKMVKADKTLIKVVFTPEEKSPRG